MGRTRKNPVMLWLSDQELTLLKNKISKTNLDRSKYLRKCSLDKKITVVPGIRDLIIELKRIGTNLNQLTRSVNEGTLTVLGDNLKDIKEDLKTVWARLALVLKRI